MRIRALDRKLLRDLGQLRTQAIAIALVVASGVALFVGMATTYRALELSEARFYQDQRFADVWVRLARAPRSVLRDLAAVPGVGGVEGRLVADAVLDVPSVDEPATGLVVSIPAKSGHTLDDVYVRRGRHVEPGSPGEVLVNEAFAEKNRLGPGDSVRATIAGQRVALRIVGVALSPEYVMAVPAGGVVPDERRYGIFWMAEPEVARLLDMPDAVNDFAIRLTAPSAEAAVIAAVDRAVDPYGGLGAYGRSSQASHTMLEEHIRPLRAMTVILPMIFLVVAAFLVNMVLSRLVAIQRPQVGMLKSFGYTDARVATHYAELALAVVLGGIAAGIPVGVWLGGLMAEFFASFFRFPVFVFRVEPAVVAAGAALTLATSLSGVVGSLHAVATLPPAVAMSPPAPTYRPSRLGATPLLAWLAPATRMILRNLTRWPVRTSLTTAGMSFAVALLVLGESSAGSMERLIDAQFGRAQREDVSVVLASPRSLERWRDFAVLPAVRRAEPFRVVPARIRVGGGSQDVALRGLPERGTLRHVVATDLRETAVPPDGALIGAWVAARLGIHCGDVVPVELRDRRRRTVSVRVVGIVDEPLGASVVMSLAALDRLIEEPETFSGASLLVDSLHERDLYAELKRAPQVRAVEFRRGAIASFRAMSDAVIRFVREIVVIFSVIIAYGMVYNTARIALAERGYELATLRVLGFTRGEVLRVLLGEIGTLALVAVPLGFGIGTLLAVRVLTRMASERFRMPFVFESPMYAFAFLVFSGAAVASALLIRRRLDRLDLVEVLKARE